MIHSRFTSAWCLSIHANKRTSFGGWLKAAFAKYSKACGSRLGAKMISVPLSFAPEEGGYMVHFMATHSLAEIVQYDIL